MNAREESAKYLKLIHAALVENASQLGLRPGQIKLGPNKENPDHVLIRSNRHVDLSRITLPEHPSLVYTVEMRSLRGRSRGTQERGQNPHITVSPRLRE